jgi:hypothetical protein
MTFRPKDITQVPGVTPDVEIFFHGQLLLRSEDEVTCEVAVNPLAINHVLTVEARTKIAGRPDPIIRMRHVGPLLFRRQEGMLIEIVGAGPTPAAFKCIKMVGGVPVPIDYTSGAGEPPDQDFRWILNLEGPQFHRRELTPPVFNSHHVIRLRGGEYFFRTAARADARVEHKRREGGQGPVTFRRIGVIASASVFLAENQSVRVRWQSPTREGDHLVQLQKAANTTHEIYINNAPLFLDTPTQGEHPEFDELSEYYKVIPEIPPTPPGTRFQLVPNIVAPLGLGGLESGSPDIPCQVQRLDGTGDN